MKYDEGCHCYFQNLGAFYVHDLNHVDDAHDQQQSRKGEQERAEQAKVKVRFETDCHSDHGCYHANRRANLNAAVYCHLLEGETHGQDKAEAENLEIVGCDERD